MNENERKLLTFFERIVKIKVQGKVQTPEENRCSVRKEETGYFRSLKKKAP